MQKAYALVIGIIFASFMLLIPLTGAFADSDPGISTATFNATFGWYNGFPMVDSYGYLDINDWTITYQSNGTPSSNPSSGDVVYLYQPGDFVEISFSNWDLLSSFTTPVWCVQFGQNPSYAGNLQQAKYTLYQSYNTSECFYQYNRSFSYDNREIKWAHCFFSYPGSGVTKIRVEYDGTPVIWNAIYIKFLGYRNEPNGSTYTQADLLQLQASISSTLSLARLADLVQSDSTDIDLSTLETTTASILQKLANVPDIIQYIDQLETIDTNILSAINTFYNYYNDQYLNVTFTDVPNLKYYNSEYTDITSTAYTNLTDFWISFTISYNQNYIVYKQYFWDMTRFSDYTATVYQVSNINDFFNMSDKSNFIIYSYTVRMSALSNTNQGFLTSYIITENESYQSYILIHYQLSPLGSGIYPSNRTVCRVGIKDYEISWYQRIEVYFRQLLGLNSTVPAGIQQTTDTVTEQVNDIVEFEDTYNDNLQQNATQIDVSSYEIQQTQGMSFMRTYTELNFDRMQNFRILFLTPLILALAAFFLRRKT